MICVHDNRARHNKPAEYPDLHKYFYTEYSVFYGTATTTKYETHGNTPFTFKTTLKGEESYTFDNITTRVTPGQYLLLNHGQQYSCEVENPEQVQSLSIFFGTRVLNDVLGCLKEKDEVLLENIGLWNEQPIYFFEKLYNYSIPLAQLKDKLVQLLNDRHKTRLELESLLYEFLTELLLQHNLEKPIMNKIRVRKASTQKECYKRLCHAADYLHSNFSNPSINLAKLAQVAQLSPAHLSKLFKESFLISPYQYLKQIRLEKACELLLNTSLTLNELVELIGYEDPSSFIRSFKRKFRRTPESFRLSR